MNKIISIIILLVVFGFLSCNTTRKTQSKTVENNASSIDKQYKTANYTNKDWSATFRAKDERQERQQQRNIKEVELTFDKGDTSITPIVITLKEDQLSIDANGRKTARVKYKASTGSKTLIHESKDSVVQQLHVQNDSSVTDASVQEREAHSAESTEKIISKSKFPFYLLVIPVILLLTVYIKRKIC